MKEGEEPVWRVEAAAKKLDVLNQDLSAPDSVRFPYLHRRLILAMSSLFL